ncbi:CitMHS family transporter [Gemmatimonas sp.]|uniref:CitMHS family transporter n=1 Tax=Gemmatimonas sp. TaxID=1962908 RepID=UPI0037C05E5F
MLTLLAYGMVIVFMTLIMTKKLSPLTALILVPIAFGVAGGFAPQLGEMMVAGITKLAPTGVMLMFAILYFAIMLDAGLFEPFVQRLIALVHGDPMKVVVGSAALALLVSLDGDGSTTYMITTAAMLPLFRRLGMRPLVLACVTMLAGGVMNILPWGGPTARAASALSIDVSTVFVPMIPALVVGVCWVLYVAYRLGLSERRRLAATGAGSSANAQVLLEELANPDIGEDTQHRRPDRLLVNALLTAALLVALIAAVLPLPVIFMIGFAVAMLLNYPTIDEQKALLSRHAGNVLAVVGLIFAAGIFTGILSGTKMVDAMADSVIRLVPPVLGPYLAIVTGVLSIPFTFFISNDAFYFGVLPILAKAGQAYGISAAEMARASLIGQPVHLLSPLVPSTFLLVGLVGVDFDDHQRYTLKWALGSAAVLLLAGLVTLVIPLRG